MPVPNTFANATTSIPLSQLDNNFATAITLGNTAIQLGNTVTTLNNMTLANVTISSVATGILPSQISSAGTTTGQFIATNSSNVAAWITPLALNVREFGAVGNGSTDDTAAIQAAINAVKATNGAYALHVPAGVYRLTSAVTIDKAVHIIGAGASPYQGAIGTRGGGSWFHLDHMGKGFIVQDATILSGVCFEHFGTYRTQPAPTSGWAPTAYDYDIYCVNSDVTINEVILLNPTKGLKLTNTQAGRFTIHRLRGQPLEIGIDIDECYDLPQISNVHFWPYWQDNNFVHTYTMANLDALFFRRVDNPQLCNIFTIFARAGLRITQSAAGTVSKLLLTNADFDRGNFGIWIDSTVTTITSSKITNVSTFGEPGVAGTKAVFIQGSNVQLQMDNVSFDGCQQNAIRVEGSGNFLSIGNCEINNFNQSGAGFPAVEALNGNTIQFAVVPKVTGGGGAATYYNGTGTIYSDDNWVDFTPSVTTSIGAITTLGTVIAKYKRRGSLVDVMVDISITTNGSGAGDVRFVLPVTSASINSGTGREVAATGNGLTLTSQAASTVCTIQKYDNTYPGGNGYRIVGSISYRV